MVCSFLEICVIRYMELKKMGFLLTVVAWGCKIFATSELEKFWKFMKIWLTKFRRLGCTQRQIYKEAYKAIALDPTPSGAPKVFNQIFGG